MNNTNKELDAEAGSEAATPADVIERVDSLNETGARIERNEVKRALELSTQARRLAEAHSYHSGLAYSLCISSNCYKLLGDYNASVDDASKALKTFEGLDDRRGMARALNLLGDAYIYLGEYAEAVKHQSRGLQICRELGGKLEESRVLISLGSASFNLGDIPRALDYFQQSLAVCAGNGHSAGIEGIALMNIGVIYERLEEYEKAAEYYRESLRRRRESGESYSESMTLSNLGEVYRLMGDNVGALEHLLKAADVSHKGGHKCPEALTFVHLGNLYHIIGEYEKSLASYHRGLRVSREIGNKTLESLALKGLGETYGAMEEYGQAIETLSTALRICEGIGLNEHAYQAHLALSQVYERQGDYLSALNQYKAFHNIRREVLSEESEKQLKKLMAQAEVERSQREAEIYRLKHVELAARVKELAELNLKLEEATNAKTEFLANMSHEIRTPMNAVLGMTTLLAETNQTPLQRDYTETIRSSSEALLTVINDILDLSKIETGKLDLEQHPVDLRECIEQALTLFTLPAAEKGLELAYFMDREVPHAIIGDATRLRQILVNLLGNAVKFTAEGEVLLSIHSKRLTAHNHEVHFAVRDTGIGIARDRLGRLFKPFSQAESSSARRFGGTGLGLSISKRLCELMGGRIWVETREGKGSTFHFTLVAEEAALRELPPHLQANQQPLANKRLLVVESNSMTRDSVRTSAEMWGMRAHGVGSGDEAISTLRAGAWFDVIILGGDCQAVVAETRRRRRTQTVPIITLAAPVPRGVNPCVKEISARARLTKPLKVSHLYETLVSVLSGGTTRLSGRKRPRSFDRGLGESLPLRILVADDNVVNRKVALNVLSLMGYTADVANNGLEVLDALRRQPYDIILCDVQMPEMDGLEVTRRIRQEWGEGHRPKLIAVTAGAMQGDREKCYEAGMDDYIAKPVRVDELQAVLTHWGYKKGKLAGPAGPQPEVNASTAPTSSPPLSLTPAITSGELLTLREIQDGEEGDIVNELIGLFLRDTPARLVSLRRALACADVQTLREGVHALRGSCVNISAPVMSQLCATLEERLGSGGVECVGDLLTQLEAEFERCKAWLNSLVV